MLEALLIKVGKGSSDERTLVVGRLINHQTHQKHFPHF